MDAGVACGNATETSNGGKLKYEGIAFLTASSAQIKSFTQQFNITITINDKLHRNSINKCQ